ncbi:MAG: hypothetical protein ACJ8AD_17680 [Gemmatimonadaceae bacterium]
MPGYRALSSKTAGGAASETRIAEAVQRHGDLPCATRLLEAALAASMEVSPVLPGWLCGRLAALYRTQGRYDDEVHLLERYRESQASEESRTRYDARLSKAQAIAHKKRRSDSTALNSIRDLTRRRRTDLSRAGSSPMHAATFSDDTMSGLRAALALPARDLRARSLLRDVVTRLCAEGRATGHHAEHIVGAIKAAWNETRRPAGTDEAEWRARYEQALAWCISVYFDEPEPIL